MDGLRKLFRTLKRLHFWILCPLVVVMGLVGWFLTIGDLQKQKQKNISDIESRYSAMSSIAGTDSHPNQNVHDGMNELIAKRRDEVAAAWQEKWDQQTREGGVLTWPDFDWPEPIKREFMNRVRDLRPIESTVEHPLPKGEDLRIGLRRRYRDYIIDELPKLAEMVGAVWVAQPGGAARNPNVRPEQLGQDEAMVYWSPTNQQEILATHFNWEGRRGFGGQRGRNQAKEDVPNLLQILYAQEDLWVMWAVMQVIQRTNADATARFNATVKEIEWLRIGKKAIRSDGRIIRVGDEETAGGAGGEMAFREREGGSERMSEFERRDGPMREGEMMDAVAQDPDPGEGRYVDKDYKELEPGKLRDAMKSSDSVAPEDAYLLVAKRIPVRMRLKVDQRNFHRLLLECANSELTIEVREVRINPEDDGRNTRFGVPTPRISERRPTANLRGQEDGQFTYDLIVELYGIIYIYNPPDRAIIGYEDALEEQADEAADVASHRTTNSAAAGRTSDRFLARRR